MDFGPALTRFRAIFLLIRNTFLTENCIAGNLAPFPLHSEHARMAGHPTARDKLDAYGIDAVCAAILETRSMRDIADALEISQGSLITWLAADPERSARAKEARTQTAQLWDDKATRGIEEAADQFELSKAKELAHHYRWRASKIAPREYGDKITQEHTGDALGALLSTVQGSALKVVPDGE